MGKSEQLFAAVLRRDFAAADELISAGASLDGVIREALVKGPSGATNFAIARYNYYKRFTLFAENASAEEFSAVTEKLFGLLGEPLYNTFGEYRYGGYKNVFYDPVFFEALLKYCNGKQMRKQSIMREIIDRNNVTLLAMCARYGWLKMPRIRDAVIKYSEDKNKTECTAFLLDFKNRNFDLAAERVRAEKKAERELNADPNSATELKKIWGCEKREDGTIIITRYKGKRTEIEVPARIGKEVVTAVGEYAFSPGAPRLKSEQHNFRRTITKVKLPDSIRSIGEGAFQECWEMSELNIPAGVVEIGKNAFSGCRRVTEFVVPETVKKTGSGTFAGCLALQSVKLPNGLAEIGDYMFSNCPALREIKLPAAVRSIGKWAFARCASLEEIVIPEGVEEIDRQAFMECPALKTVVIPASVKSIKDYKYRGSAPETVFHDSPNVTAVVEPKSYAEKYCKRYEINFKYKGE